MTTFKNHDLSVTLHSATTSLPEPSGTPTEGTTGDTREWRAGTYSPGETEVSIDLDSGGTSATLPGPVQVCGYDSVVGRWRSLGYLNAGASITVSPNLGFAQKVGGVAAYDHLQLFCSGGTVTGDPITVRATPYEEGR